MKKTLKISGIILGVFVLLVVLTVIIVPMVVDVNSFKPAISDIVMKQTGRQLVIEDDIKLKLFPRFSLDLGNVRLSNAKGFVPDDTLTIKNISVGVSLFPLLRKQIEISRIIVDGVDAYYIINKDGVSNVDDIRARFARNEAAPAGQEPAQESTAGGGKPFLNMSGSVIDQVSIKNINLNYTDERSNIHYLASVIEIFAEDVGIDKPVNIHIAAKLEERTSGMLAELTADAMLLVNAQRIDLDFLKTDIAAKLPQQDLTAGLHLEANALYDMVKKNASVTLSKTNLTAKLPGRGINASVDMAADAVYDITGALAKLKINSAVITAGLKAQGADIKVNVTDTEAFYDLNSHIAALSGLNIVADAAMKNDNLSVDTSTKITGGVSFDMAQGHINIPVIDIVSDIKSNMLDGVQQVKLSTALSYNLNKEQIDLKTFDLNAMGVAVKATLMGSGILSRPDISGSLSIAEFAPKDIIQKLNINYKATDVDALKRFTLSVPDFVLKNDMATASVKATLDSTEINTTVKANLAGEKPAVNAALNMGSINLDRYMPAAETKSVSPEIPHNQQPAQKELALPEIDLDLTSLPDMDIKVNMSAVTVMKSALSNIAATAVLKNGNLKTGLRIGGIFNGHASVSASVTGIPAKFGAELNTTIANVNLHNVLKAFAPDVDRATLPQKASLMAAAQMHGKVITLSMLDVSLDYLTVQGNAKADFTPKKPIINFVFNIGDVDLNRYLPKSADNSKAAAATQAAQQATPRQGEQSKAALDLNSIPVNLNGSLAVRSVKYDRYRADNIVAAFSLTDGKAQLAPLALKTFGGMIDIKGTLESKNGKLPGSYHIDIKGLKMGEVVAAVQNNKKVPVLAGDLNAGMDITLAGITPEEIRESINGKMNYIFSKGVINGIGYDPKKININNLKSLNLLGADKSTTIQDVKGIVEFVNGRMNFERINMVSGNMSASMLGGMELKDLGMHFQGDITVDGVEVPLTITGNFTSPTVAIDYKGLIEGLMKRYAEKAAQDAIKSNLGDTKKIEDNINKGVQQGKEQLEKGLKDVFKW